MITIDIDDSSKRDRRGLLIGVQKPDSHITHNRSRYLFINILIILVLFHTGYSQERPVVAVLELVGENVAASDARIITGYVEENIFKTQLFKIASRSQIDKVIKEQAFQQSGMIDLDSAVRLGKILAVNKVIIGSIGLLGNIYSIQIKLINVENGELENINSIQVQCSLGQLPGHIGTLVNGLFGIPASSIQAPIIQESTSTDERVIILFKEVLLYKGSYPDYRGPMIVTNKGIYFADKKDYYWHEIKDITYKKIMWSGRWLKITGSNGKTDTYNANSYDNSKGEFDSFVNRLIELFHQIQNSNIVNKR